MSAFFSKLFTLFLSKVAKNALFALYCKISIAVVRLHFNLVRKCRYAFAGLRCASTESKSSLRKLRCASEIKKITCAFCIALLVTEKIAALCCAALLIKCYLCPPLICNQNTKVFAFHQASSGIY